MHGPLWRGGVCRKQEAAGRTRERGGFLSRKALLLIGGGESQMIMTAAFRSWSFCILNIGQLFRCSMFCCCRLEFLAVGGIFDSPTSSCSPRANLRLVCLQTKGSKNGEEIKKRKRSLGQKHQKYKKILLNFCRTHGEEGNLPSLNWSILSRFSHFHL